MTLRRNDCSHIRKTYVLNTISIHKKRWSRSASCGGTWRRTISSWWLKVINNPLGRRSSSSWYLASVDAEKRWEKRTGTSKWNLLARWDNATTCVLDDSSTSIKGITKEILLEKLYSVRYQSCDAVWCWWLWRRTPSCASSSSSSTTWWCVDGGSGGFGKWKLWGWNDNKEDFSFTCFPLAFLRFDMVSTILNRSLTAEFCGYEFGLMNVLIPLWN